MPPGRGKPGHPSLRTKGHPAVDFTDGYDTDQALSDLRRIANLLAERDDDDNAQEWASDLTQAWAWFATGQ